MVKSDKNKTVLHGALTGHRNDDFDALQKAAKVLTRGNNYSRVGKMSEALLSGKHTLVSNAKIEEGTEVEEEEEIVQALLDDKFMIAPTTASQSAPLSSILLNTIDKNKIGKKKSKSHEQKSEADEKNKDLSHFFKTVKRDDVRVGNFLGSNAVNFNSAIANKTNKNIGGDYEFQNLGPGHYHPRYDTVDKRAVSYVFHPVKQSIAKHADPDVTESHKEAHSSMSNGHNHPEKTARESIAELVESNIVPQDQRFFSDKSRGPTSMFKSKTKIRILANPNAVDQMYNADPVKFQMKRDVSLINMDKQISREQREGRVVNHAPDAYYDGKLNVDTWRPRLSLGMSFDQMSITRDQQRKGARMTAKHLNNDVSNNPLSNDPSWGIFYDKDEPLLNKQLLSHHQKRVQDGFVNFEKMAGRTDLNTFLKVQVDGAEPEQQGDGVYALTGILSANQAYDKTHPKLKFTTYFDKMKPRDSYLYPVPDHIHLQYDVEMQSVWPREKDTHIVLPLKPQSADSHTIKKIDTTDYYDLNHSLTRERGKAWSFSKNASRDKHKSALLVRGQISMLDKFYDHEKALEFIQPRLKGDPLMKTQKGRAELYQTSKKKKKKKSLAQKHIDEYKKRKKSLGQKEEVPKEFTDYIDINQVKSAVSKKAIRTGFVDYARSVHKDANEFEKRQTLLKRKQNANTEPEVASYNPSYSLVEPGVRNVIFSKSK